MAAVSLEGVGKVYPNGVAALQDLTLDVADGELLALVGPSGSGKTTALRLIAGLEDPTTGTIRIGARVVNALSPRERDVAMLFQRHSLYPHLTVAGNLAFGLRLRNQVGWLTRMLLACFHPQRHAEVRQRTRDIGGRVAEAARMLGLADVLERLPSQLSGGQQQRTALGRALVRRPAVFLLDEPLSHLDAQMRAEIRGELHLLHRRLRATMIYVTHDQLEAMTLGDRVVVLDGGRVQQVDRPAGLYDRPDNRFVAGFIGWPPMSFLEGHLAAEDGCLGFVGAGCSLPLPREKAEGWRSLSGKPLILGIRPENVGLARGESGEARLAMEVVLVEALGGDLLVSLRRGDWQVTGKLPPPEDGRPGLTVGQNAEVAFDMRRGHLFDPATGLAVGARDLEKG